jgi:hypothetical protein
MKDSGKMEKSTAMEFTHGKTDKNMKVNTLKVRCTVMEFTFGLTDKDMKATM